MKDDDSTRLTEQERRVLAEMELALKRDAPDLDHSFRQRSRRPRVSLRGHWSRLMWWGLLVLGTALLVTGLLIGAVLVGGAGFVVVLVAVHELSFIVRPGSAWRRVRQWFGRGDGAPDERAG